MCDRENSTGSRTVRDGSSAAVPHTVGWESAAAVLEIGGQRQWPGRRAPGVGTCPRGCRPRERPARLQQQVGRGRWGWAAVPHTTEGLRGGMKGLALLSEENSLESFECCSLTFFFKKDESGFSVQKKYGAQVESGEMRKMSPQSG